MWEELFEEAYRKFSDIEKNREIPRYRFNFYELCHIVGDFQWRMPLVDRMVSGELMESINELNAWVYHLNKLKTWHDLLVTYEDEDARALDFISSNRSCATACFNRARPEIALFGWQRMGFIR